jgi:hypothetical protein
MYVGDRIGSYVKPLEARGLIAEENYQIIGAYIGAATLATTYYNNGKDAERFLMQGTAFMGVNTVYAKVGNSIKGEAFWRSKIKFACNVLNTVPIRRGVSRYATDATVDYIKNLKKQQSCNSGAEKAV